MLRLPVMKLPTGLQNGRLFVMGLHTTSCKLQQELVEVFIDDKPVQVPPGTTVLQVNNPFFCLVNTLLHFTLNTQITVCNNIITLLGSC